ncbi:MAG: hypothetical protein IKA37_08275 [Spirochaetales bacterium]|nr:hypothetical protein [Spirochaetales bacterium]
MKILKIFGAVALILLLLAVVYLAVCALKFAYYSENDIPRIDIDTAGEDISSKEEYVKLKNTKIEYNSKFSFT